MEEVEEANRAAVESCHRVLTLLSVLPQQDLVYNRNLMMETGTAVLGFKTVLSLLNNKLGHARVRKSKNSHNCIPQSVFLDPQKTPLTPFGQFLDFTSNGKNPFLPIAQQENPRNLAKFPHLLPRNQRNLDEKLKLQQENPPNLSNFRHLLPQNQRNLDESLKLQNLQMVKNQAELLFRKKNSFSGLSLSFDNSSSTAPTLSSSRSFLSSLSIDGSVANVERNGSFNLIGVPGSSDQSSQPLKRKCLGNVDERSVKFGSSSRCHCSKKRKHRVRRSIKVPAVSTKLADIPPDDYSWRKYGQKPIKGSPYPRGYYKCSSMRGCPARKHVERCLEDPSMLNVTYEGEHNHPRTATQLITT